MKFEFSRPKVAQFYDLLSGTLYVGELPPRWSDVISSYSISRKTASHKTVLVSSHLSMVEITGIYMTMIPYTHE